MENDRKPWEQLPDEPDRAYARFLVYLRLGPGRSIEKAYNTAAEKRGKTRNGQWEADSARFDWRDRAAAYDVAMLSQYGADTVINWVRTLSKLSELAFEKVTGGQIEIRNLSQLLEVINVLGTFVTPETIQAAREFTSGNLGQPTKRETEGAEEEL